MSLQDQLLAKAGKKTRAAMAAARRPDPVAGVVREPLDTVLFASSLARKLAEDAGFNWRTFASSSIQASSDNGYTASDVRAIIMENGG